MGHAVRELNRLEALNRLTWFGADVKIYPEDRAPLRWLSRSKEPLSPTLIAVTLSRDVSEVKRCLERLWSAGLLRKLKTGYVVDR